EAPTDGLCGLVRERVGPGLRAWAGPGTPASECRRAVLAALPAEVADFLEPCAYLGRLLQTCHHLPEVQCGCAHRGMHGRNVLVGLVDGEAQWPGLFDYEHMNPGNLLGWDFVKLETELKVRALQMVFPGDEGEFITAVHAFEKRLAEATER